MNFSPLELIVIAILVILLFGVKRLPELGSGLGQAINNFKKSFKETQNLDSKSGNSAKIENKED